MFTGSYRVLVSWLTVLLLPSCKIFSSKRDRKERARLVRVYGSTVWFCHALSRFRQAWQ